MQQTDLNHLEKTVTELSNALSKLGDGESLREFLRIIHQPGFTTPAEVLLFRGIADSLLEQTRAVAGLKQVLLSSASKVELNPQPLPPKTGRSTSA